MLGVLPLADPGWRLTEPQGMACHWPVRRRGERRPSLWVDLSACPWAGVIAYVLAADRSAVGTFTTHN